MLQVIILTALCAVFATVFLRAEMKESFVWADVWKGLASLCFVLIGVMNSPGGKAAQLLVCGLILGFVADILLNLRFIFKKRGQLAFLIGILVFLAGHIVYLIAILEMSVNWKISIAIGVVLTVLLILWLFKNITAKPLFMIFGIVYIGAIMLMNAVAMGNLVAFPSAFTIIFALGAVLFLISDIVLIINTFGKKFRESFRILNIVLYYAGQILIGVSMMFL